MMRTAILFLLLALPNAQTPAPAQTNQTAAQIATLINQYRGQHNLPPIPISPNLTKVAEAHIADLEQNHPDQGDCNMHSWSSHGSWKPVCYTPDHAHAKDMWSKPSEITGNGYPHQGYEIAFSGTEVTAESAVDSWKTSPPHNGVILEQGLFQDSSWKALGVAASKGYAVVWFGKEADPASHP